jgi:hypothetical protein
MIAALALAAGACGGDDDADVSDDAAASDVTSVVDDSSPDVDSGDDSGGGEWCDLARELDSNDVLDDVDIEDPDAIESAFEEMIDLTQQAADSAPDEIKDDVELVVETARDLVDELRDVDFDFTALDQSVLDNPEATAAGERIDAYGERVCGIDGGSTDDTDVDTGDDTLDTETDATDASGDDSGLDGTTRDQVIAQLTGVGLTEDQANCIVDNVDDLEEFASTGASDPTAFLALVETCDIDLTQLQPAEPGG